MAGFLGRYLSTPKPNIVFSPSKRTSLRDIAGKTVVLDPKTQLLYLGARFFINGEVLRAARGPARARWPSSPTGAARRAARLPAPDSSG